MSLSTVVPLALLLVLICSQAQAWTYEIYGLCNFYNTDVGLFEYDDTSLATASGTSNPYQWSDSQFQVADGDYHHIFQCDDSGCFADNNMRVYTTSDVPLSGLLTVFWTNDKGCGDDCYNIQACGPGVGGSDIELNWHEDSQSCWEEGQHITFDASEDNYIIVVDQNGRVDFKHGTTADDCKSHMPVCEDKACCDQHGGRWNVDTSKCDFNAPTVIEIQEVDQAQMKADFKIAETGHTFPVLEQ